ncbi:MAG: serine/threonine-protein kinase [Planctomycetaceae bacterium]
MGHLEQAQIVDCPDIRHWREFASGLQPESLIEHMAAHLETCERCLAILQSLDAEKDSSSGTIVFSGDGATGAAFRAAIAELRALSPGTNVDFKSVGLRGRAEFTGTQTSERPADDVVPDHYEIHERLGSGHFGVVYRAVERKLHREVALKLPSPRQWFHEADRKSFLREAQAASRLSHEHVVQTFAAGESNRVPYIASALVCGPSLSQRLASLGEPLPVRQAARLIMLLGGAVQHAHAQSLIHRDIKPGNILLAPSNRESASAVQVGDDWFVPKLADFGLAKSLNGVLPHLQDEPTESGIIKGTPEYMAPEQADGRKPVDERTDIYALGVVLYRCLTGQVPVVGDSPLETLKLIGSVEIAPPSRLCRRIPADLDVICLKCLRSDALDRYETAQALADDLNRFLEGQPIQARPTSVFARTVKWARRRPFAAALAALLIVGSASGLFAWKEHHRRLDVMRQRTERIERMAQLQAYVDDIGLAWQAWQNAQLPRFREYLNRWRPGEAESHPAAGDPIAAESDLRGFEWFALESLLEEPALWVTLRGHRRGVTCVRFDPAGRWIATAGQDGQVKLWDAASKQELLSLDGHVGDVNMLAFSPGGDVLASAGDDGTIRIWNPADGSCSLVLLTDGENGIYELAFSPDGRRLFSGGRSDDIHVWDAETGAILDTLETAADGVTSLQLTSDGHRLLVGHGNGEFVVRDAAMLTLLHHREDHIGEIGDIALLQNDELLVTASRDGTVRFGRADARLWEILSGHNDTVLAMAASADGQTLATASRDLTIRLWDRAGRHWVCCEATIRTSGRWHSRRTVKLWRPPAATEPFGCGTGGRRFLTGILAGFHFRMTQTCPLRICPGTASGWCCAATIHYSGLWTSPRAANCRHAIARRNSTAASLTCVLRPTVSQSSSRMQRDNWDVGIQTVPNIGKGSFR